MWSWDVLRRDWGPGVSEVLGLWGLVRWCLTGLSEGVPMGSKRLVEGTLEWSVVM